MGVGWTARSELRSVGREQAEGIGTAVAKLIEFHVPKGFRLRVLKVVSEERGRVIEFRPRNADAGDSAKNDLWRRFMMLPLRSAAIKGPHR